MLYMSELPYVRPYILRSFLFAYAWKGLGIRVIVYYCRSNHFSITDGSVALRVLAVLSVSTDPLQHNII